MNFNDRKFTKEEFLALPIFPHNSKDITPNTEFLLGEVFEQENVVMGKMALQQEALLTILEKVTAANTEELEQIDRDTQIKVRYWRKQKDGNISERGGYILMGDILDSMRPPAAQTTAPEIITFDVPEAIAPVKPLVFEYDS